MGLAGWVFFFLLLLFTFFFLKNQEVRKGNFRLILCNIVTFILKIWSAVIKKKQKHQTVNLLISTHVQRKSTFLIKELLPGLKTV